MWYLTVDELHGCWSGSKYNLSEGEVCDIIHESRLTICVMTDGVGICNG